MAHLTPHAPACLVEAFPPPAARRRQERLQRQHPPTPGRELARAETARRVLARPGVDRRLPDATPLTPERAAWERHRHDAPCRVEWRFTPEEASRQPPRLDPSRQLG